MVNELEEYMQYMANAMREAHEIAEQYKNIHSFLVPKSNNGWVIEKMNEALEILKKIKGKEDAG